VSRRREEKKLVKNGSNTRIRAAHATLFVGALVGTVVQVVAANGQSTGSTSCALPSGQTRLAHDGATVCAPHSSSIFVDIDCCDWNTGTCYAPSTQDTACGASTSSTAPGGSSTSSASGGCTLQSGYTRLAHDGTTVCAPHSSSIFITLDCCDWYTGTCYPPSPQDVACAGPTPSSSTGGTTASSSNACTPQSGFTRLAHDGATVCAPHSDTIFITVDCCDWYTGTCYPPSAQDTACGTSGSLVSTVSNPPSGAPTGNTNPPPPSSTAVPDFDAATIQNVRNLVAAGAAAGNAHDVFAKIGDSITESASFLYDCGFG
jgi:hypothetical protein